MKYRRTIFFFSPLLLWLLGQVFLFEPRLFYISLILASGLILLSVRYLTKKSNNSAWLLLSISPLVFFLSLSFYATVITNPIWLQTLFLLVAGFSFLYFKSLYYHLNTDHNDRLEQFDNLLLIGGFLSIFFSSATLYILPAFLNWPLWLLLVISIPVTFLLFYQFLVIRRINWVQGKVNLMINVLILTELIWVLSLLPFNFNILGYLTAIFYYFLVVVQRLQWRNNLSLKSLKISLILVAIILTFLFLTVRWL